MILALFCCFASSYQRNVILEMNRTSLIEQIHLEEGDTLCIQKIRPYTSFIFMDVHKCFIRVNRMRKKSVKVKSIENQFGIDFGSNTGTIEITSRINQTITVGATSFSHHCDKRIISNVPYDRISFIPHELDDTQVICYFNTNMGDNTYNFKFPIPNKHNIVMLRYNERHEKIYADKPVKFTANQSNPVQILFIIDDIVKQSQQDLRIKTSVTHNENPIKFTRMHRESSFLVINDNAFHSKEDGNILAESLSSPETLMFMWLLCSGILVMFVTRCYYLSDQKLQHPNDDDTEPLSDPTLQLHL